MLSRQEEDRERRETLLNDQRVREQGGTMHAFAEAEAGTPRGRFSAVETTYVVGSKADVASAYSAASSAHQTELPPEPPTGYRIDELDPGPFSPASALEPSVLAEAQATGDAVIAPSASATSSQDVERTASPPSSHKAFRRY
jgi:hypothetical protein